MPVLETDSDAALTDSSVVGNAAVVLALGLAGGAAATTELSVVGKSGGAELLGAEELLASAGCVSGFWGRVGVVGLFFSRAVC